MLLCAEGARRLNPCVAPGDVASSNVTAGEEPVELSICMVALNCWKVLEPCLESLLASKRVERYEVIVVDNGSTDGTQAALTARFPWVKLIENGRNDGFTKATNQGIRVSTGRLILWLNTDTILREDSLEKLVRFLKLHADCGIVGPRVLNADGSFQPQCRRGVPTVLNAAAYRLGLDMLWPSNRTLGHYLLRYVPEDQDAQVGSVSGCCLLTRREVWDAIGTLDDDIFGFGEDLDWCVRAKEAGWEVWYTPSSVITHLKGQGGVHSRPYHKVWGIHQAMWIFFRKYLRKEHSAAFAGVIWIAIWSSFLLGVGTVALKRILKSTLTETGKAPTAGL